jgi:hypothetical protein
MCELCPVVFSYGTFDILSKLATPVIAVVVAIIAFWQWDINRASLREKLFERRFLIFNSTHSFLSEILIKDVFPVDSYAEFVGAVQRSRFLFGTEFQKYLDKILDTAHSVRKFDKQLEIISAGDVRDETIRLRYIQSKWLNDQASVIFEKFEPYIGFEKYK